MNTELTKREKEIYKFFVKNVGISRTKAAKKLCVSFHTVKTHLMSIYSKLNIHSIPELVQHYYMNKDIGENKNDAD